MRWVALVGLVAGCVLLFAQEERRSEKIDIRRLPAGGGFLWAHVPNCKALRQDWRKGFLAGLLFDKEMQPFLNKMAKKGVHGGYFLKALTKQQLGVDISALLKGFEKGLLLHLRDLQIQPGRQPESVGEVLKFLFVLDVGDAMPAWQNFIEKLVKVAQPAAAGEHDIAGVKVRWAGSPGIRVYNAFTKGVLLGSFDLDTMRQAIKRATIGKDATSIYTKDVKAFLSAAGVASARIVIRLNLRSLLETVAAAAGPQGQQLLTALAESPTDPSNIIFAAEPTPQGGYRELFISKLTEKGAKTLTTHLAVPKTLLAKPNNIYLLIFMPDLWGKTVWKSVLTRLEQQEALMRRWQLTAKGPLSKLRDFEKTLGFKIEELAKQIGGGSLYVVRPPGGGAFPEAFASFSLNKPQEFESKFNKLMSALNSMGKGNSPLKRKQLAGATFWLLEIPEQGRKTPMGHLPWTPIWGVADGRFLVASSPLALRALLKSLKKPIQPDKTLSDFLKKASGSVSAAYLNLPSVVTYLYNTLIPFARKETRKLAEVGIDIDLLPDAETIASHFPKVFAFSKRKGSITISEIVTDKGFGYFSDAMTTLAYVLLSALGSQASPEKLAQGRVKTMEMKVCIALSAVWVAQMQFKAKNNKYASSLDALIRGKFLANDSVRLKTHRIKIISADENSWAAVATPLPNSPIKRHYYIGKRGEIHYSDSGPADKNSPVLRPDESPLPRTK
ncbi:MAG: hypothetical protein DRP63_01430 [Planctomycetota bacterium]|nr:MAG: hypothetical protein DRP63_01430 [Planctomycetota bacterium]